MDEIIYLEPDEEITSVIDKMKNANSPRLGLVIPREATLLQSIVNLRLLQREAASLNKEIAVVTTDKIGRNLAAQVGLQVFSSVEEQKPIYQPPQIKPDISEVIELDETPKNEELSAEAAGVSVHHFQEKPIEWRKKQSPVYRGQGLTPSQSKSMIHPDKPTVGKIMSQKQKDLKIFKKLIWPIVGVIAVLAAIASYLLLPHATVTISVPSENLPKSIVMAVTNKVTTPNLQSNLMPGELIEVTNEKKDTYAATGEKTVGTKASGNIKLYNNSPTPYTLNAGAKLSSSSKTFVTKSAVTAPGASAPNNPGTATVAIEAENPGPDSNVAAGKFVIIGLSESQQQWYYCQSSSALSGGASHQVQVVSQKDYDTAKNKLVSELTTSVKKELESKIKDKKVIDGAQVTPDPAISVSTNVDGQAKNFDMNVKLTTQVMVFDMSKMKDFLINSIQTQVATDKMVAIASDNDVGYESVKTAYDKGELNFTANVNAKVAPKIDTNSIKNNILGKNLKDAESIIKGQPGISKNTIDFWPAIWFKQIPYFSRNVTINVDYLLQ
jgi:hypothetical protein